MATIPSASVRIDDTAGPTGAGIDLITVIAPVPTNADCVPRLFANTAALLTQHGYAEGVDYCDDHFQQTGKPVLFVGVPIVAQGAIGRVDTSGNTDTSVVSLTAGGSGALTEADVEVVVVTGGVVGTAQIVVDLSLDGGFNYQRVRVGTASSYAIPYSGLTLNFAGGSLTAGDTVYTAHVSGPRWNAAGLTAARTALAAQSRLCRSMLIVGDLVTLQDASDVCTEINAYETANNRFQYARVSVRDRLPTAVLSQSQVRMTGAPNVTFAEVGAGNDTAVRSAGSFITDGFHTGGTVRILGAVAGTGHNNITGVATVTNATTLTFPASGADLDAEGPIAGVSMTCENTLTFVDGGAGDDTLIRSEGSWLADGFRTGDILVITGTGSNNHSYTCTNVTATTVTFATNTVTAEIIGAYGVSITTGETKAQWAATIDALFETITDQPRIDMARGRYRPAKKSIGGWNFRRSPAWCCSCLEYDKRHAIHIPVWQVKLGSVGGTLNDANGNLVEWDEYIDGGDTTFTSFRTWPNKNGVYVALSLTRATEGSLLSRTQNMAVASLAQTIADQTGTDAVGEVLVLKSDGTAETSALNEIKQRIESALRRQLLADNDGGRGPRASNVSVTLDASAVLNVPGASLPCTIDLQLLGTIEHVLQTLRIAVAQ